jgi:LacI family transcriptional regulator, xylobiose transport system transcriptional regulator
VTAASGGAPSRTTLARLAEEAGVSLSTISKVLNGRPDVAPATRDRVERLLDAHDYQRRSAAGATLIELVFHELTEDWSMQFISGAQEVVTASGMSLVLTASGDWHTPGPEWVSGVLRRRPAGVVLVFSDLPSTLREQLRARAIPFAVIDPAGDPPPGVPSVGSANWAGGLAATRHLLELGHERIAVVSGRADMMCSLARVDGFRSAMRSAGVPVREDWVHFGDFQVSGGRLGAERLLASDDRPTAIFAGSDLQALGVIEVAREQGIRVPDDLSVVGYDDVPVALHSRPQLTTVHQPLRQMAALATRMVLRLAEGETLEQERVDLATHLVVRDSTARVPA